MVTLTIPDVPPSLNVLMRLHWRNQHALRQKWILWVRSQLNGSYLKAIVKVRVKVTLCHARLYDADNAVGACKVVVDALKDWRLIYDDTKQYLELKVEQQKCPHKKRHTIIELEAV
jgi:hypothetical protein